MVRVQSISPRPQFNNFSRDNVPLRKRRDADGFFSLIFINSESSNSVHYLAIVQSTLYSYISGGYYTVRVSLDQNQRHCTLCRPCWWCDSAGLKLYYSTDIFETSMVGFYSPGIAVPMGIYEYSYVPRINKEKTRMDTIEEVWSQKVDDSDHLIGNIVQLQNVYNRVKQFISKKRI